jgi:hypothetical protein
MADVQFVENGQVVVITCTKFVLVMSRAQFLDCLRRGKTYQRHLRMQARVAQALNPDDAGTRC